MNLKKKVLVSTGITAIVAAAFSIGVYAASDIKLIINGKQATADVQIIDGSSYVPLRVVSEMLGANVKWDGDTRTITIAGKDYDPNTAVKAPVKSYDVNVSATSGPIKFTVNKVTLDPAYKDRYSDAFNALILDVTAENTTDDTITFAPIHGSIAMNTKEQVDSGETLSSDLTLDGDYHGKVIKTGKIVYKIKGNLADITSLNFNTTGVYNSASFAKIGNDISASIILK
jgi:hypothetical protein